MSQKSWLVFGAVSLLGCGGMPRSEVSPSKSDELPSQLAEDAPEAEQDKEFNPQTWIAKLDDSAELEQSLTKLRGLRCPEAITPVGNVWEKQNRRSDAFSLILYLADQPHMVNGHENFPDVDCPDSGEGPYWKDAIPFLITAVQEFDVTSVREIEDAAKAAEALGRAKAPEAIQVLIDAATKKEKLRPGQLVRIAALIALGEYGDHAPALDAMIKVLGLDPGPDTIYLISAAAQGLAVAQNPRAVVPLIKAIYQVSPIYTQLRNALSGIGKPASEELLKVFRGEQSELNQIAVRLNFSNKCNTKGMGPGTTCIAPGNIRYKAARLLGDLRYKEAIPSLVAALNDRGEPAFFDSKTNSPGPVDSLAVLEALRTMGAYRVADKVLVRAKAKGTYDQVEMLAIDVYSSLAKDRSAIPWLRRTIQQKKSIKFPHPPLRKVAILALSRLATQKSDVGVIRREQESVLTRLSSSLARLQKTSVARDRNFLQGSIGRLREKAIETELHITRARVGVLCGKTLSCYRKFLSMSAEEIVTTLQIPNHAKPNKPMSEGQSEPFQVAARGRALLEIAKMGTAARSSLPELLSVLASLDRTTREGTLRALVEIAPTPCDDCATRLTQVINEQKSQSTLSNLTVDTQIVLNYFLLQGAKVSASAPTRRVP